jgi:D-alanyl-D-alanine carboxypeptidase/D-alanyl-D-alanine-endopeptidase (penicillin-binding protein 4)
LGNVVAQEVDSLVLRLDSVIGEAKILRTSQMGLMVYDLDADSVVYQRDALQTLRPASTMKLLTAITALDRLGAEYEFTTRLMKTDSCDYYLIGCMDPLIGTEELNQIADSIKAQGIDTIHGSLFADRSMKDADLYGEGWCWDDDNPVLTPLLYDRKDHFTEALAKELRRAGVVLADRNVPSSSSRRQKTFITSRSHSLGEVLIPMMKESDNLFAESVFYQMDAGTGGQPATGRQAASKVRKMIQKVGLQPGDYKVADGSGLSLYNYVSAELEVYFLRYAWFNRSVYAVLMPSLPVAGVDGTLKNRMTQGLAARNVYAKTGTLTGISSLAGYCVAPNGHALAFCIINQGVMRIADGRAFQDAVCQALCEQE